MRDLTGLQCGDRDDLEGAREQPMAGTRAISGGGNFGRCFRTNFCYATYCRTCYIIGAAVRNIFYVDAHVVIVAHDRGITLLRNTDYTILRLRPPSPTRLRSEVGLIKHIDRYPYSQKTSTTGSSDLRGAWLVVFVSLLETQQRMTNLLPVTILNRRKCALSSRSYHDFNDASPYMVAGSTLVLMY